MNHITKEITNNSQELGINIAQLTDIEINTLKGILFRKYFSINHYEYPLYHFILKKSSIQDEEGWRWIEDFLSTSRLILFFEQREDDGFIEFESGKDLINILSNSFFFTFYLTNKFGDFLISYNQYDFLICAGSAEEWMLKYIYSKRL